MLLRNIKLKKYSNYKIGGRADYFLDFKSVDELKKGLIEWQQIAQENKIDQNKILVIGDGTNILFPDEGLEGLVLKNSIDYIHPTDNLLEVGGGTSISNINNYCISHSLSGLEWSGGLPGTLGGAIYGNAGAFGGETKDSIISVQSFNLKTQKLIIRDNDQCEFNYRNSIYKKISREEIIIFAKLKFTSGNKKEIKHSTEEKINYRKKNQPLEYPNIGSIFKNLDIRLAPDKLVEKCRDQIKTDPFPVIPAAYLVSLAGLKGKTIGDAQISNKHPNFIVNLGNAESKDVKSLIKLVQKKIKSKFEVNLETEVIIL